ncbi:MAG: VWA domain-containing protein [Bryobacteraceae bacterium]
MIRLSAAYLVVLLLASSCFAQRPEPAASDAVIRTNVPLVLVPVTVTDRKGKLIDGLQLEDFILTDEGKPQKVRLDTSDTVLAPIALVIAIQTSGISSPELAKIRRVSGMFKPIVAGERGQVAVISYNSEVKTLQEFTTDASTVSGAVERINAYSIKTARMIDAISEGAKMLATRPENYRRILLILGESRDRGSKAKLTDVIEEAQRAGVAVYSGTYSVQASAFTAKPEDNPSMPATAGATWDIGATMVEFGRLGNKNAADAFAKATGGGRLSFTTLDGLEKAISRAGEEIHSQYLLSFVPQSSGKTGFHQIQVAVPKQPYAVIRVRPGYWPQQ